MVQMKKGIILLFLLIITLQAITIYILNNNLNICDEGYTNLMNEKSAYYDPWQVSSIDSDNYYENLAYKNSTFHVGKDGDLYSIWWINYNVNESMSFWIDLEKGEFKVNNETYNIQNIK